jgi:shikimate kinase
MNQRIYLLGFMGSGKTTVGRELATRLHWNFTDLDEMIEDKYRITIPTIFQRFDEAAFRKIEQETLRQTFILNKHVIATGGGTPCFFNNLEQINRNGISVYLKMEPGSLHNRLMNARKKRPLIEQNQPDQILSFIEQQLWKREFFYSRANYIIQGENLDMDALVQMLKKEMAG